MAIYKIEIVDPNYGFYTFENFENSDEILHYKRENEIEGAKITFCEKAESLIDFLSDLQLQDDLIGNYNPSEFYLNKFVEKFGMELLNSQFPTETSDLDLLIVEVQKSADKKKKKKKTLISILSIY